MLKKRINNTLITLLLFYSCFFSLVTLTLEKANSQTIERKKEPLFIIYPVMEPKTAKDLIPTDSTDQKMAERLKVTEKLILKEASKKAFELLGISYEIASPIQPPKADRFQVTTEKDGEREKLVIKRNPGSETDYTEQKIKELVLEQLPPETTVKKVYKEYNAETLLKELREQLKTQLILNNKTNNEYYIFVMDNNIYTDLYTNFVFWTSLGKTSVISQKVIMHEAYLQNHNIQWSIDQVSKLIASMVLQRLGVEPSAINGCLSTPIYNAQSLFELKFQLNNKTKRELATILGRELNSSAPATRPPRQIIREGNQELTQTSYEKSMSQFIKIALEKAKSGDGGMLRLLIEGANYDPNPPNNSEDVFALITPDKIELKNLKKIVDNLDTSKDPKVLGYDSTLYGDGKIGETCILFAVPQINKEDAGVILQILRQQGGLHLIKEVTVTPNPIGYKKVSDDPQIPKN